MRNPQVWSTTSVPRHQQQNKIQSHTNEAQDWEGDFKLVIGQLRGEYEAKEGRMQKYLKLTNQLVQEFNQVDFTEVPQSQNSKASEVARKASSEEQTGSLDLKVEV